MPLSVQAALAAGPLRPGDMAALNDPFRGGTHLPDITLVAPAFAPGADAPAFLVANRAHHADVGGMHPGSMSSSTDIFQEGIRIPPLKLIERGRINRGVMAMILSNVRTPEEREGDLAAQIAANNVGVVRLGEIIGRYGLSEVEEYAEKLQRYAESMIRKAILDIPDGQYSFEDYLDDDGVEEDPVKIAVKITIRGDEVTVDFSGSSAQVKGNVNAVYAITLSAAFYSFLLITPSDVPHNSGCLAPIRVVAPEGLVVNARYPAAVAGGNVETSQRIVDVLLGALSQALPGVIPAASSGTMNNFIIGGYDPLRKRNFTYYETIGGGMGARPNKDGVDAIHTHMTNTLNTPVEALEHTYPLRARRYQIRQGTGGSGKFRGGDGVVREVELLCDAQVSIVSDRRKTRPYGLAGGKAGAAGENVLIRDGVEHELGSKVSVSAKAGDIVSVRTPGGGGYGKV